jgi:rhodanese-related sulfurtransferase
MPRGAGGRTPAPALITRDELKAEIADGTVVIDALPASYFSQQHLPTAINIVEDEVDALAKELLPILDAAIATYCSNEACANSGRVATRLEALGYTNVRKYREGIQDWVEAGLPTEGSAAA